MIPIRVPYGFHGTFPHADGRVMGGGVGISSLPPISLSAGFFVFNLTEVKPRVVAPTAAYTVRPLLLITFKPE